MSGIVGVFHRDGAPVDGALVQMLARYLAFRGPDRCDTWWNGPVGFGHAMLRSTRDCPNEIQPAALDAEFWITADARLDRRVELATKLQSAGRQISGPIPDSELILQAYATWGESCVDHVNGDFAFAIWDARERKLFCARDHFGIKPFYYAEIGNLFLFGNTLNCLRLHPGVADDLNEAAIADFLLFGLNCDDATTTFRQIRRLPPAHALSVSTNGIQLKKYWSAPTNGAIRYQRANDYIEHFDDLLRAAVGDRLRTDRIGILMSGGLDSSSVASIARDLTMESGGARELLAYTTVRDSLVQDPDRTHACQVAEYLRIPINYVSVGHLRLFERWDDPEVGWPEPVDDPLLVGLSEQFGKISVNCRVALSGEGCDNLMYFQLWPYVKDLLRTGKWSEFAAVIPFCLHQRSSIFPGFRRRIRDLARKKSTVPGPPRWFAADFARRVDLEARFKEWSTLPSVAPSHPILPDAHASLLLPQWTHLFEQENSGVTGCPVEVCYPYLDLRIVNFLLSLPPVPLLHNKALLREVMKGHLPESVRLRPKTPLVDDPSEKQFEKLDWDWLGRLNWCGELSRYVNLASLPAFNSERNTNVIQSVIRPICLNFWLHSARGVRYNFRAEACHG